MEKPTMDQFRRLQHLVERCLHDLEKPSCTKTPKNAGLALNRWTLEELMSRHPSNSILVIRQILDKLRELEGTFNHDGFVPLALMFWSTVIYTPHIPQDTNILNTSYEEFHKFLTWPQPAGGLCRNILHFIKREMRAPGITFQRLARAENEITSHGCFPNTKTILLLDPTEVPQRFSETVQAELKLLGLDRQTSSIKLIRHLFQSACGSEHDLDALQNSLETQDEAFVQNLYLRCVGALEKSDSSRHEDSDPGNLGQQLCTIYEEIVGSRDKVQNNSTLEVIPLPIPNILVHDWKEPNLDFLYKYVQKKGNGKAPRTERVSGDMEPFRDSGFSSASISSGSWPERDAACETRPGDCGSSASWHSEVHLPNNKRPDSGYSEKDELELSNIAEDELSDTNPSVSQDEPPQTDEYCLPLQLPLLDEEEPSDILGCSGSIEDALSDIDVIEESSRIKRTSETNKLKRKTAMRRKLQPRAEKTVESCALHIVVFGRDKTLGRLARAYNRLRIRESRCSLLMKYFRLQFYYIPIRDHPCPTANPHSEQALTQQDQDSCVISQMLGTIDTWYERNVGNAFSVMTLLPSQSTQETKGIVHYPFWANTVLYYSRFANHSVTLRVYQMEVCLMSGKTMKEIFIQEMQVTPESSKQSQTAGNCRRPSEIYKEPSVSLSITYNKVNISNRVQKLTIEKNFTSVKISRLSPLVKADMGSPEANLDTLYLATTEPAGKQTRMLPFVTQVNQQTSSQIKNPPVRINAVSLRSTTYSTLTVMLDNDESKVFQDVISCEVSACINPEHSLLKRQDKTSKVNAVDCHPFLCLPINTFSARTL